MALPAKLYHWTEALYAESIAKNGLRTNPGGWLNQHDGEPAVSLTTCDSVDDWNPDIFYLARPVRIEIDTTRLDAALFAPDLNSLLDESCASAMDEQGLDAQDPSNQTWQVSLEWTGNCRYLASIPSAALSGFERFVAPRDWGIERTEAELYGEPAQPGRLVEPSLAFD